MWPEVPCLGSAAVLASHHLQQSQAQVVSGNFDPPPLIKDSPVTAEILTLLLAMAPGGSNATPVAWALVRHYEVLFSSDKDKRETNRVWHDGKLTHHTYNGKMFLFDETDVELADKFDTRKTADGGVPLLADQSQLDIGDYLVEIQRFERVSKTDLTPLLDARDNKQVRQHGIESPVRSAPQTPRPAGSTAGRFQSASTVAAKEASEGSMPGAVDRASATNRIQGHGIGPTTPLQPKAQSRGLPNGLSASVSSSSPRKGPSSPHPFKTPFKSPLKRQAAHADGPSGKQQRTLARDGVSK